MFVGGWFMDRFDVSRVLTAGFLVWSLATAATGLVHPERLAWKCSSRFRKIKIKFLWEWTKKPRYGCIVASR